MKTLFFTLPIFIAIQLRAQDPAKDVFPIKDSAVYYERIFEIDSASKEELFKRAKVWALSSFNSQKSALQSEDKELGFLLFNTFFSDFFNYGKVSGVPLTTTIQYWFNFKVYLKDNRAKVVVDGVRTKTEGSNVEVSVFDYYRNYNDVMKLYRGKEKDVMKDYLPAVHKSMVSADQRIQSVITEFGKGLHKKSEFDF
jgi:hypothetical protein